MSFTQLLYLNGDFSLTRPISKNFSVYRRPRWFRAALLCLLSSFVYHFIAEKFYQPGPVDPLVIDIEEAKIHTFGEKHTRGQTDLDDDALHLLPRDVTWDQAITTGAMIMCLVDGTTEAAQAYLDRFKPGQQASSRWTEPDSLAANGWLIQEGDTRPGFTDAFDSIFTSIGLDIANNVFKNWRQLNDAVFEGVTYRATGGKYGNVFNPQGGMIAADENYSPAFESKRPRNTISPLQQWSDVVFLAWKSLCQTSNVGTGGLRRIFRIGVSSSGTDAIIQRAVGEDNMKNTWANKVTFNKGSDAFNAILGTVNGYGIGWMLLQHRADLGLLTINSISYFYNEEDDPDLGVTEYENLYFEISPQTHTTGGTGSTGVEGGT